MKKRKKPIFLLALLILAFGTVAAMNSSLLSEPKTPEELEKQQELDAMKQEKQQQASQPKKVAAKAKAAPKDDQPLVAPPSGEDDGDKAITGNVKRLSAIPENAPKIVAAIQRKDVDKDPDHASTQAQSGWYQQDSYAHH